MSKIRSFLSVITIISLGLATGCGWDPAPAVGIPVVVPNDFLSGSNYNQLIIEVQYMTTYKPLQSSIDNLKAFIESRVHKTAGVTINVSTTALLGSNKVSLSDNDLDAIQTSYRTQYTSGAAIGAYILFVDADYEGPNSPKTFGLANPTTTIIIFEKTIRDFAGGAGQPSLSTVETTVLQHEMGHLLGLVGNGTQPQTTHQDTANGRHCTNTSCLMYYTVDTSNFIANLLGDTIPTLDAACLQDLAANGGK